MNYIDKYCSPIGNITMASDGENLIGLWLDGQKYYANILGDEVKEKSLKVFENTKKWLNIYFSGKEPNISIPIKLIGSDFRKEVWNILLEIPYGKVISYGGIAKIISRKRGFRKMSSQAIGGAVGHNPISIIVPCHRVVGAKNNLTGYAGGIAKKIRLLELEGINTNDFVIPEKWVKIFK